MSEQRKGGNFGESAMTSSKVLFRVFLERVRSSKLCDADINDNFSTSYLTVPIKLQL